MSFAVLHMKKMKQMAIKGMQFHNQRERESETNPDIDPERSHLNYDLLNPEPINYNERINSMLEEGVTTGKAVRKDAVRLVGFLVTSDKGFFDQLSEEEEKAFFETSLDFFKEKYGEGNLVFANVHKDEKTPHMHVGFVPLTEDGRLSAKDYFGRKSQMYELQDEFHQHVKEHGFDLERGISSDKRHLETGKFKQKTLQEENERLAEQKEALEEKVALTQEKVKVSENRALLAEQQYQNKSEQYEQLVKEIDEKIPQIETIEEIRVKPSWWSDHVKLSEKDWEGVSALAKKALAENSKETALKEEMKELRQNNTELSNYVEREAEKIQELQQENKELKKENRELGKENRSLLEQVVDLEYFKEHFQILIEKVKEIFLQGKRKDLVEVMEKTEENIEKNSPSAIKEKEKEEEHER